MALSDLRGLDGKVFIDTSVLIISGWSPYDYCDNPIDGALSLRRGNEILEDTNNWVVIPEIFEEINSGWPSFKEAIERAKRKDIYHPTVDKLLVGLYHQRNHLISILTRKTNVPKNALENIAERAGELLPQVEIVFAENEGHSNSGADQILIATALAYAEAQMQKERVWVLTLDRAIYKTYNALRKQSTQPQYVA